MLASKKQTRLAQIDPVQCVWGILCTLSSIDQERNNVSLFNVIDQVNIPRKFFQTKGISLSHEIITLWRRILSTDIAGGEINVDISIVLIDSDGNVLSRLVTPLRFNAHSRRARLRIQVDSLALTKPGDYSYEVSVVPQGGGEAKRVLSIPLEVKEM